MSPTKVCGLPTLQDGTARTMPTDGHNDILSELPPVLTLEQAAEVLQIGVTTARGMCRQHQLPAFKVGAQWRIPRAWLIEFMRGDCHVR